MPSTSGPAAGGPRTGNAGATMSNGGGRTGGSGRREGQITLSGLRTFVAVVEAGGLSRAAEVLGITQPSVTIQLNGLEEACGVRLLHRRPRLLLTDAGRDLFVRARLILSRLNEFEASVGDLRALRRGRLAVGLSAPHTAMPLLSAFLERLPATDLAVSIGNTATLLADVSACRIDIGIMALAEPATGLACTLVARQPIGICVRADHPLARRRTLHPADLDGLPLIVREEGSMTRQVALSIFAAARWTPTIRLSIGSREALKEAVAADLGVGIVFMGEAGNDPRLSSVPLVGTPDGVGVYAVALRESLDIPLVGAFMAGAEAAASAADGGPP
jgi:LysR family transcriptional regulator, low CO2-responsive transcriptional regulator